MNRYTDEQIKLLLRKPVGEEIFIFIFIFYYAFSFCRLFVSFSPGVVGVL